MRKKLDTRFPAARIKKIMQADEEVGKIALATPVLISKALEIFLQDLCDRTYEVTCNRGAKTLTSSHMKHCVSTFSEYDFLKEVVSKVAEIDAPESPEEVHSGRSRRRFSDDDQDEVQVSHEQLEGDNSDTKHKSSKSKPGSVQERPTGNSQNTSRAKCERRGDAKPAKRAKVEQDQSKPRIRVVSKVKSIKVLECGSTDETSKPKLESSDSGVADQREHPVSCERSSRFQDFDLNFDLNADPPPDGAGGSTDVSEVVQEDGRDAYGHPEQLDEEKAKFRASPVLEDTGHGPSSRKSSEYESEDDYDCASDGG